MFDSTVFAFLLLGHVLADFVFQPSWMVDQKDRPHMLLLHGLVVFASHAVAFIPLLDERAFLVLGTISAGHVLLDSGKQWLRRRRKRSSSVSLFLIDQALHLLVLFLATLWITDGTATPWLDVVISDRVVFYILVATVAAFNVHGGSAIVRLTLKDFAPAAATPDGRGSVVGVLERWIIVALVFVGQWAAVGLVLAAKSLARFEELKDREFAEYYLVGTLTSVLVAVLSTLAVLHLASG